MSLGLLVAVALASAISQPDGGDLPVQAYVVRPVNVEVRPIHELLNCCGDLDAVEVVPDPYAFMLDGQFEVVRVLAGLQNVGDVTTEHFQVSKASQGDVALIFVARRRGSWLLHEIDDGVVCLGPDEIHEFDLQTSFASATTDEDGHRCIQALQP